MNFTHLHVHSHYSVLDGMSKVPDLVDKAIKTGMHSIALTDHGNMYGIKELLDYCKKVNKSLKEKAADGNEYIPFKPIVGVEAYCARRGRLSHDKDYKEIGRDGKQMVVDASGWHLILLAKNSVGYHNLCRLVSFSFFEDSFYRTPRIDKELLEQYHDGIICSSACLGGEISQKIIHGDIEGARQAVKWFHDLFGSDYYIEIQRHETQKPGGDPTTYEQQKRVNPVLIQLARENGVKVICTNDVHFVEEEHAEAHDRLICLSTNHFVDDVDRMHYTKQEWLKTPEEMAEIFSDIPEALENTQEIVDKVEVYDIDSDPIMPKFPIPEDFGTEESYHQLFSEQQLFDEFTRNDKGEVVLSQEDAEKKIKKLGGYERLYRIKLEADYLKHLTMQGALKRYGAERLENDEVLKERINFELHTMKSMGFPGYFLIVMDFIRGAREELGVSVGPGRGSAAGSVVAYCLHITDLDPLEYDLLFERFLNPDRISLPDIDTDFDDAGRQKVLEWVSEKYGRTHVAHIITYGAMAPKSAIADVGRVQRVPLSVVNQIKSYIPDKAFPDNVKDENGKSPKVNLKNCYKYVNELKDLVNGDNPEIQEMLHYAQQLENTVRQVGVHACGVIIGADDLTKFAPLSSVEDKETGKRVLVTEYDGHVIESVGLIKMDFLGLKTLTIIRECLNNIKKARGEDVDIDHISKSDPETYRLFQEGRTIAVFQFESPGMQKYMKELKPSVMGDLIAMNALYRPGPMQYIPQFIRRKQGLEEVTYDIPCMEKYLKDTYGVTVYQEQVMLLSRLLANFTRGESDKLRKAMGKKQMAILQELKGKFMEGGKANGHSEKVLDKIWKDWEAFASYAFNKSHAACYSWVAYQTAYLKAHYPAEFMAANLTVSKDDIKEVTKFMDECKNMHISVLEPDVNESELNFTVNSNGDIRFGLGGIKGVGEGAVEAIVNERKNGKYRDIFDFVERVNLQACNRKTLESLAQSGAFDSFRDTYREQLLGFTEKGECALDVLIRYGNKFREDKLSQMNTLFGDLGGEVQAQHPELPSPPRMNTIERLNIEKNLIGIYLSAHPLDEYEFELKRLTNFTTKELNIFENWRKPDQRNSATLNSSSNHEGDEEETEDIAKQMTPAEFFTKYEGQPLHFGGLITLAEEAISQKGNPYGKYTIEDYAGNYKLALFGETYRQFAPMMKQNLYVYISGTIQQYGKTRSYFKPKPVSEATYELVIQQVDLLGEAQEKHLEQLSIKIPLDVLSHGYCDALCSKLEEHTGKIPLKIQIYDESTRYAVSFLVRKQGVKVDHDLYHWLEGQEEEGYLTLQV
ncbi:MAG: DNA polymerase III subunit alpha [Paludibacteraceae bacterium]|nr:DNA polymerase III subunit alpha [Paludibacteraceae bacterium]